MDNEIIDNALTEIAEAKTEVGKEEVVEQEVDQEDQAAENDDQEDQSEAKDEGDQPFPKKAVNALARRDKQLAKMRNKYTALEQEVAQLRQLVENGGKSQNDEPDPDDYDNYSDFLMAKAEKIAQKKIEEALQKGQNPQVSEQDKLFMQREQEIMPLAQDLAKRIPDFVETIDEYAEDIDELPVNIQSLLLHAENPPLATYNLIKSGKLEALARMPEAMAAAEIIRAQSNNPVRRASQAPAPVKPISGSPRGQKSIADMSPEELMAKFIER